MKKASIVLIVIGAIFFAAGVFAIYTGFASQNSDDNSLVFEKTVQARITDMRISDSTVGETHHQGSKPDSLGITTRYYYVTLFVSDDGGYSTEKGVSAKVYNEYEQLEKNKDMEFNLYRNTDGSAFFSLKDLEGATADYQELFVSMSIGYRMIAGLIAAAIGWVLLMNGGKMRKKPA
ncbi:MAG: hypothetical protein K2K34_07225 [Oscillospiraceae bacterium]|nr:hypothetical protein [Oscillospiraceae bacterium]